MEFELSIISTGQTKYRNASRLTGSLSEEAPSRRPWVCASQVYMAGVTWDDLPGERHASISPAHPECLPCLSSGLFPVGRHARCHHRL